MHLVLTHEQADFDAVASLVAARVLDPQALAVLPRRVNRNVRAFLTLYGDRLHLIEFGDLPKGHVERVTLVDTQSPPSLKGVGKRTRFHVVDHHPPDPDVSPDWVVHLEDVGATTTLLVEMMQEAGVDLDFVAATILLTGIYEDTGSLSYPGTSPRDLQACAWLLDRGASLVIASDFLNHPLSADQRLLYERLLEAAETHDFHGLSVVICGAAAEGLVDEISSVAHKLRDVFDPAGLFVLVALDGNIQMVARSTSDSLDVGRVAERFGGGGHNTAAAALIRGRSLEDVREELLGLLPEVIEPPMTVEQIMSRGPQLLDPDVTVEEAAERMQRFGHEGYPVIQGGEVVGLLTRRAVDRAMAHGMGRRAVSSVMEAGRLVVHPSDSVQQLQLRMIEHAWGQVPVADQETGDIIGIVTRTDLLKTLGMPNDINGSRNLVEALRSALPPGRLKLLRLIADQAESHGSALYIVGGFVRDLLLGEPSIDFDLVVEGDAIRLATGLAKQYGGRVSSHRRFGTAKWRLDPDSSALRQEIGSDNEVGSLPSSLDFVTARAEFYSHPTALPSVRIGSIKLDLHRRDFTINTLALRLDGPFYGQLLDHWGGGSDLHQGLIRVLHSLSFVDDPTRALRAVRLEQRLGFKIENRSLELLQEALPLVERVSGERIRHELALIFEEARLPEIMGRLHELGLLTAVHPGLTWNSWLAEGFRRASDFEPPEEWGLTGPSNPELLFYSLWVFKLPESGAQEVCRRLKLPNTMSEVILDAWRVGHRMIGEPGPTRPSQVVTILDEVSSQAIAAAWLILEGEPEARQSMDMYLTTWRFVVPSIDGNALRARGLPPGPAYRRILWALREAWLDSEVRTVEEEAGFLERLIRESKEQT